MHTPLPLSRSLDHADRLLDRARPGLAQGVALGFSGNPYFVDLPSYGGGISGAVQPESLRVLAALYFTAEVEGTYLMSVGEELARVRYTLNLTDREAAQLMENLADAMQDAWVPRELRNQIFGRVFGIGYADPNLGDTAINREFEPRMARFCAALVQSYHEAQRFGGTSSAYRAAAAARSLFGNLAARMQGNTLVVAERLNRQLRLVLAAINHRGLATLFRGANAWDVVRAVLGADTPDLEGHINRAQTGLRLLSWAADHIEALRGADPATVTQALLAEPQSVGWAEIWLASSGVAQAPAFNPAPAPAQSSWPYQPTPHPTHPAPQSGWPL